jgi:hypothetical protein
MSLTFSFDLGYASIGWCVLSATNPAPAVPEVLGTGVVTFPTDDCLASTRRDLRRTRRHVRSTRQRIERMKLWLLHRGVLTRDELDRPGHPAPFLLAAAALQGHRTLDAYELWTVLRWYAHNRGYDGNARWANGEESSEDTEKEQAAIELMGKAPLTKTMCETVCKCLGLNPAESDKRISSSLPYKTLNAAYPRKTVTGEVGELLSKHLGKIPGLDSETVRLILKSSELVADERDKLLIAGIKLTKRYSGGLLFGQLVPRFDNRIISRCPITWANNYDRALADGETEVRARKLADKFAKVPAARCVEFLEFRFASIIANLRANNRPLDRDLRRHLFQLAKERGSLTANEIEKEIHRELGNVSTNLDAYFKVHPDSEKALVMDPAAKILRTNQLLKPLLPHLSCSVKEKLLLQLQRNRGVRLGDLLTWAGQSEASIAPLEEALIVLHEKDRQKGKRKDWDFARFLTATITPEDLSGRAPFSRAVLRQVVEEILSGPFDPRKASRAIDPDKGEDKPENGILYDLGIPKSRVRHLQNERPLAQLTNNHLVRHRMMILERLLDDLVAEFVTSGNEVSRVVVEVARELAQFSGMTAKKISIELNSRLKDFKSAVDHLANYAPDLSVNGGIIRKCRIAMDLGWCCPFTGVAYDAYDLPKLEREHIIPYATRNTNALHALVLTWPEINRMKGKRTARQFITDDGSKRVPGKANLDLFTLGGFDAFVEKLKVTGHDDDRRRQRARKALLATTNFEDKELGFTDGALTKTSHLMKLAMRGLALRFPAALCEPIPGSVTGEIRKAWKILGTLSLACPEAIDLETGEPRPKDEIRGLTHMHHALDAATIALAAHYFPLQARGSDQKGKIWQALLRRNRSAEEKEFLYRLGIFDRYQRSRRDKQGNETLENDVRLRDLPRELKEQLRQSLAQCRVAQHLPSDRSGAKAELTTWGILSTDGEGDDARVKLHQRTSTVENGIRKITVKSREERSGKLLGNNPKNGSGKLQDIKGAIIIGENYGVALDPVPTVIPFHNVTSRLNDLRDANGGKPVRVLRNGMLILLKKSPARSRQDYSGIWKITSIKNNKGTFLIDMIRPGYMTAQNGVTWSGMNKTLGPLLDCGLVILPRIYSGHTQID